MRLAAIAILLAACAGEKRPCYVGEGRDCGPLVDVTMAYRSETGPCQVPATVGAEQFIFAVKPAYEANQPDGGPCLVGPGADGGFVIDCLGCGTIPVGCNPGRCDWLPPRP